MTVGDRCSECASALASDQRWCLACGARTPRARPELLAGLLPVVAEATRGPAAPGRRGMALPTPRSAAAAILLVLGFGCVVGTTVAPDAVSQARRTVVVLAAAPPTPAPAAPVAAPTPPASEDTPAAPVTEPAPAEAPAAPAPSATPAPSTPAPAQRPATPEPKAPPLTHVAVIALSGQSYAQAFAPDSAAPYLARELPARGALLRDYETVAGSGLANEIALLSGQPSNFATELNCPTPGDVTPATLDRDGIAEGVGCVYPAAVQTLPGALESVGKRWKAYIEDAVATTPTGGCAPVPGTVRDPFAFFHSLADATACAQRVTPLSQLDADLAAPDPDALPNLLWVVPGSSTPDLPSADAFVRTWAEKLLAAPAFRSGLLVVLFDAQPPGPSPSTDRRVGAVLVSRFVKAGTVVDDRYDHLNLLRTLAEAFGVPAPGNAGDDAVAPFGRDVFSAWKTSSR